MWRQMTGGVPRRGCRSTMCERRREVVRCCSRSGLVVGQSRPRQTSGCTPHTPTTPTLRRRRLTPSRGFVVRTTPSWRRVGRTTGSAVVQRQNRRTHRCGLSLRCCPAELVDSIWASCTEMMTSCRVTSSFADGGRTAACECFLAPVKINSRYTGNNNYDVPLNANLCFSVNCIALHDGVFQKFYKNHLNMHTSKNETNKLLN